MSRMVLAAILAMGVIGAGCGGDDDDDDDTPAATASSQAVATGTATGAGITVITATTTAPPFAGTLNKTEKEQPGAGQARLTAVRIDRQEGFDRIVFEFAGPQLPGYSVEYVTPPAVGCASGMSIDITGGAQLLVKFRPANAHDDAGNSTVGARELKPNLAQIVEAESTCDFEGLVSWGVGVKTKKAYRVLELAGPARIVVDILQ